VITVTTAGCSKGILFDLDVDDERLGYNNGREGGKNDSILHDE
jgi:hypothetical protein